MPPTQTKWLYLERDPKSSYKQLSIKGRRVKARTLYSRHVSPEEPRTVEQLAEDWNLPVAAVEEAIAYCRSKPPEIEQDWQYEEALAEMTGMNEPGYKYNARPRPLTPEQREQLRRIRE